MSLYINTNVASESAQKNLGANQARLQSSFARLSSGLRINSAKDDAAGLAISESLKSQIRSFNVAERNAGDGISMAQTAEGSLGEVHGILGRMRELAVQASNGPLTAEDRGFLQTEFSSLQAEITRIQGSAKFNGKQLLGATADTITLQVGLNDTSSDQIQVQLGGVSLADITGSAALLSGSTEDNALAALSTIDTAIGNVSTARSTFGAAMNRLEVAQSSIQTMRLNLSAANSRIADVDVASETAQLSRNQVLTQAGISVLAQANQLPQLAFGLLH
ncbi:MAG TPA: flagellin [Polyangiaceae bacterium]|jgi:flagellin|nr:flagellin [Polyangiaceae bacterium]